MSRFPIREVTMSGGCQCGAVRYRAERFIDNAHLCHCRMCQKAVGNLFAALVGAPKDAVTWTRGEPARFRSSAHVDRGFCRACGTPLFYDSLDGDRISFTIGSLDRPELFKPRAHDGIEGRMPWFFELNGIEEGHPTEFESEDWAGAIKASSRQHPDRDTAEWPLGGER
jgi:hypothetical protein